MNDKRNYDILTKFKGRNKKSSTSVGKTDSLLLILKWGGELTPMGKTQAEELGRAFRCVYPGGQGKQININDGKDFIISYKVYGIVKIFSAYQIDRYFSWFFFLIKKIVFLKRNNKLFSGEYGRAPGFGFLRLHSTYRHDLKIYASDEGRVQTTAAAFTKVLYLYFIKKYFYFEIMLFQAISFSFFSYLKYFQFN